MAPKPHPYADAPKSGEFQRLRRRLTRQVEAAVREYHMIEPGDHVMVCCSGGKDSYTLLTILIELALREDFDIQITAYNLNQGQPGFPARTLPDYFKARGLAHFIQTENTYSIVKDKIAPGKTTCALCSRLRRGLIYAAAEKLRVTKIALGHHRDDAIETLLLNLFFGARLKAMPPKLSALKGKHTLIRPLYHCGEAEIARFARAMAYPIIPCDLCGSQPNLQRQAFKAMLTEWEMKFPGRREAIFKAMKHIVPSHLADTRWFDFERMEEHGSITCQDMGKGSEDTASRKSVDPADFFARSAVAAQGFMALLNDAES